MEPDADVVVDHLSKSFDKWCKLNVMADDADDTMILGPEVDPGVNLYIRRRGDQTDCGLVRSVKEGEPLYDEALMLQRRGSGPVYDVTPVFAGNSRSKPTTDEYRNGWEKVFGKREIGSA